MYLSGFGNHHQTEAITGALPTDQNSPQKCPLRLFAEQLSGSAFTRPRHVNLHSWLYRKLPSVVHQDYELYSKNFYKPFAALQAPNPMRWSRFSDPEINIDFIDGITHLAGNIHMHSYLYQCNQSMTSRYFSNHDGEFLFVPYQGRLALHTEFGLLEIAPGMIAVIPRGIKFKVTLLDNTAAGYLCENKGLPFALPSLGPLGANSLANPRHFLYPTAAFEDINKPTQLISKYEHNLWMAQSNHSPLNVVAWHGNYAPYSYDLSLFNTINTVSFDHPDPSIFTVLTSESEIPGIANLDFVIFPSRWMVAEHTFRPPYFHRNIMNEFMGLLVGHYDAKAEGFEIGGFSIHNTMTAHGPDTQSYQAATVQSLKPAYYDNTLAFMFESREPWLVTEETLQHAARQTRYTDCWQGFKA
ncbi:MAG: homogentisate 1,2-dioxygenase [Legionellaceae bacterium]|nr:homogentisate 1,2-dioxygenase [Legionellaceae bacterium]